MNIPGNLAAGQMLYWNGNAWLTIDVGTNGSVLVLVNGVPTWSGLDAVSPTIISGSTGTNLTENSGAGQTVYTITADANDGGTITSYAIGGTDAGLLTLTGKVLLN